MVQNIDMDLFRDMKGPSRPAPSVPGMAVNRYSPVTNWNDDPFGADVFEPSPHFAQKKKPPPRPPPPKIGSRVPDIPAKPSHFIRKPTVLSSLLSRKPKTTANNQNVDTQNIMPDIKSAVDTTRMFPKCEPKIVQTSALIDFSSPPSSPTFTTRSSSDGLSVDSFGSDATTSTNHHNAHNGNASQAESGFEDDFDLFLHSRKGVNKEDTVDDFTALDPFSPQPTVNKPPLMKKPVLNRDLYELSSSITSQPASLKGPTIIRAKPARPKPPDNTALLKNTFGSSLPVTTMFVNTTTPIQKVTNGFGDSFDSKPFSWDDDDDEGSLEREPSPPMPMIPPPPPPPPADADDVPSSWPDTVDFPAEPLGAAEDEEAYAVAIFDYFTDHPDDLCFSANSKIKLIRRVDHEWLYGSLRNVGQGLFPSNYVEIKVPLPNAPASAPVLGTAVALYDFEPVQPDDLRFVTGDTIKLTNKLNDEWYIGECNGMEGQFPINYVQIS